MHSTTSTARCAANRHAAAAALAACCALAWQAAGAQEPPPDPGPGLLGSSLTYANGVERAAAEANDLVYRRLNPDCNPGGVLDQIPSPEYDDIVSGRAGGGGPGPLCTADAFFVYLIARELFHTANELQGTGPTAGSLGLDQEGLGLALRWTAAEELAAQSSMATEFANGQLSTLAARLQALRFSATGFGGGVGRYERLRHDSPLLAQAGGGAAEEGPVERYSPWGGFINYGFGYGSKAPTSLEDAFDFDGSEVTLGADYRLPNNVVLGGILGMTEQDIDFDEAASQISVVDGHIAAEGDSFILFALSQGERMTISGSIGTQSLDYKMQRDIKYPSFNPDLGSVYSIALSSPEADVSTTTFGFAYAFRWNKLSLEPYVDIEHMDVEIGAFAEERSISLLSDTSENHRFDLAVSAQDIQSLRSTIGVRFQYVVTPRFGVIVPYWSLAGHREHEDDPRTITTGYAVLAPVLGSNTFALPTDPPDETYFTFSAGASMVLRGGRQREVGGAIAGGIMGFLQFATVENRAHYDDRVFTAGIRYEF